MESWKNLKLKLQNRLLAKEKSISTFKFFPTKCQSISQKSIRRKMTNKIENRFWP